MGRPSKLSDAQWEDVKRRLAQGESVRALAREYNVSPGRISSVSKKASEIISVANQMVTAEKNLRSLTVPEQRSAIGIANELMAISQNLARAGSIGAANSKRLQELAEEEIATVDMSNREHAVEVLKGVNVLTRMANDSANIGLSLLAANKERMKEEEAAATPPRRLDDFYG